MFGRKKHRWDGEARVVKIGPQYQAERRTETWAGTSWQPLGEITVSLNEAVAWCDRHYNDYINSRKVVIIK